MTTLFDIGDVISVRLIGEIKEYTKTKNGDCYRITIKSDNPSAKDLWVYLGTEELLAGNARLEGTK